MKFICLGPIKERVQGPHYVFLQILPLHFAIVFLLQIVATFDGFFFLAAILAALFWRFLPGLLLSSFG